MLRDRKAQKRDRCRCGSLNTPLGGEDDGDVAGGLDTAIHSRRTGCYTRCQEEQASLAQDVTDVTARMPGDLQELARELRHQESLSAVARGLRIPRTTLQHDAQHIRRRFEDAGLRDYL